MPLMTPLEMRSTPLVQRPLDAAPSQPGTSHAPSSQIRWVYVLFFISGFPALLYQIVWQRALFTIYGVNIESVTIVVSAFMLGLGVGSLLGGMVSKSRRLPLLIVFAFVELATALFGVFSLKIFHYTAL